MALSKRAGFLWLCLGCAMARGAGMEKSQAPEAISTPGVDSTRPDRLQQRLVRQIQADMSQSLRLEAAPPGIVDEEPTLQSPAEAFSLRSALTWPYRQLVNRFNFSTSLNVDLVGSLLDAREPSHEDAKRLFAREIELAFSADFTPNIRGDIFLNTEREGDEFLYNVEEGYVTFLALPWDLQARAGKFKTAFGQSNLYHTHARPWIDVPLAQRVMFGEEGLVGMGVSLNRLVSNPWDIYSELTLEIFDVVKGTEVGAVEARDLAELIHWKTVFDLNADTALVMGLTAASISQREGGRSTAEGLDVTLKWRPLEEGLYRSFTWQSEIYSIQTDADEADSNLFGGYTSVENQFSRRWFGGLRFDVSETPEELSNAFALVPFVTFRQTDRMYWRFQYNHIWNDPDSTDVNSDEFRIQFNYSLGTHRPHPYL